MKKQFKVFKQGMTDYPITICSKVGEPFDEQFKRNKYIYLGYTIIEL